MKGLKLWREQRNISQARLAHVAGISQSYISSIEQSYTQPSARQRKKIEAAITHLDTECKSSCSPEVTSEN